MKRGRKSDRMIGLRNEFMKQAKENGDFEWLCDIADRSDRNVVDYLKKTELYYAEKIGSGLYAVFDVDGIDDDMERDSDYLWLREEGSEKRKKAMKQEVIDYFIGLAEDLSDVDFDILAFLIKENMPQFQMKRSGMSGFAGTVKRIVQEWIESGLNYLPELLFAIRTMQSAMWFRSGKSSQEAVDRAIVDTVSRESDILTEEMSEFPNDETVFENIDWDMVWEDVCRNRIDWMAHFGLLGDDEGEFNGGIEPDMWWDEEEF